MLVVLLALFQIPMLDSLNVRTVGRWPFGSATMLIPVAESIVYVSSGSGWYVLDVNNPSNIIKLDSFTSPGAAGVGFSISETLLLVSEFKAGLTLYNIARLDSPQFVCSFLTPDIPRECELRDGYAYVACFEAGLRIIDYHDPYKPVEIGFCPLPSTAYGVKVKDTFAYVTDWMGGFRVINIANPRHPFEVFAHQRLRPAWYLTVKDSLAIIAWDNDGLRIWNISNPTSPYEICSIPGFYSGVRIVHDTIALADGDNRLNIFNIANPTQPVTIASFSGTFPVVLENRCYGYIGEDTIAILDITNPANPILLGTFAGFYKNTDGICTSGNYVFTATRGQGLRIYDITNRQNPLPVGQFGDSFGLRVEDIEIADSLAYLACYGTPGLRIVNVSDPRHPVGVSGFDSVYSATGICYKDSLVFVAARDLWIVDVKNPYSPRKVAKIPRRGRWMPINNCAVSGNLLITAEMYGVRVFDISDPANPRFLGGCDTVLEVHGVVVNLPYAFLSGAYGLLVFDLSDPINPRWVTYYQTDGYGWDIALDGNLAYVATEFYGVQVFDVSNPVAPRPAGYYITPIFAFRICVSGGLAYVADSDGWLILQYYGQGVEERREGLFTSDKIQVVYENATKTLRVKLFSSKERIKALEIFNTAGITVSKVKASSTEVKITPFTVAAGVYFIKLSTGSTIYNAKFTIYQ